MDFRSVAQLSDQVLRMLRRIPGQPSHVIAPSPSSMVAASLVSAYRRIPLLELSGLANNDAEQEIALADNKVAPRPQGRPLVLLDVAYNANDVADLKGRVQAIGFNNPVYAAIFIADHMRSELNHFGEVVGSSCIFEWNIFHDESILANSCLDMDGVICCDPSKEENDDGNLYAMFLQKTRPLHKPSQEVGYIVTSRLESYREETVRWLEEHEVKFRHLIMLDLPDRESRRVSACAGAYKAEVYRNTGADLFIESSLRQAVEIANLSQQNVFCTDTMQMIRPGMIPVGRPSDTLLSRYLIRPADGRFSRLHRGVRIGRRLLTRMSFRSPE
jgi:orotate phosphoribosyltransferase